MPIDLVYRLLRPVLFALPPEMAHDLVLKALARVPIACTPIKASPVHAMGLTFPHRVGLAAGLDKSAQFVDALRKLGFAFIEVGTVTPQPQAGNPKPRLFRLPAQQALINRMGFNNPGLEQVVENLLAQRGQGIVGVNIGKNKTTPLNRAIQDYQQGLEQVYPVADYVTINISSPNTPDLRLLQQQVFFSDLLSTLTQTQARLADEHQRWVPLVVKCSPDESSETLKQLAAEVLKWGVQGIIATNTTITRPALAQEAQAKEAGGLSGHPLFDLSMATLRTLKGEVGGAVTLIAAGGIDDETRGLAAVAAGATLIQLYTGLIYQGPGLVRRLARGSVDATISSWR